jgi:hypothetical protein
MNLSSQTIDILTNFSKINNGIVLSPGNSIRTKTRAVYAEATVAETFPVEVSISDLQGFLRMLSLFKDPMLGFTPSHILIANTDRTAESRYPCAKPGSIAPCSNRKLIAPPVDTIRFTITQEQWATLQRALGVGMSRKRYEDLGIEHFKITSDGATVYVSTASRFPVLSSEYSFIVNTETHGHECNLVFSTGNAPLMAGSYEVTVNPNYAHFRNTSGCTVQYWVGSDPRFSSWGGKTTYQVKVTKSMAQECHVVVQAHTAEEAEALVRQKADEELKWTAEPQPRKDYKVFAG